MQGHKICVITTVHGPFDDRIFQKECVSLVKEGYSVTVIAQNDKNEVVGGVNIVRLPKAKNRLNRMFGLATRALRLALREKADAYHFHDPELLLVGLVLKLVTGKKVIYDVHEDYAAAIHDKDWLPKSLRKTVAFAFNIFEKLSARLFDVIIAATPDIAVNFPQSKTFVIRNVPVYDEISGIEPLKIKKERPVVIYAGGLSRIRGIKEVIQAMGLLGGSAELWLLGTWESDSFQKECEMSNGWQFVKYLGFKKLSEVYSHIKAADVGLHCIHPLPRYLNGLPVKCFEYLACGIPVILSDSKLWRDLFRGCALFVNPLSPEDIAENIKKISQNGDLRNDMIENGGKLIYRDYNWETESGILFNTYGKVLGRNNV